MLSHGFLQVIVRSVSGIGQATASRRPLTKAAEKARRRAEKVQTSPSDWRSGILDSIGKPLLEPEVSRSRARSDGAYVVFVAPAARGLCPRSPLPARRAAAVLAPR